MCKDENLIICSSCGCYYSDVYVSRCPVCVLRDAVIVLARASSDILFQGSDRLNDIVYHNFGVNDD